MRVILHSSDFYQDFYLWKQKNLLPYVEIPSPIFMFSFKGLKSQIQETTTLRDTAKLKSNLPCFKKLTCDPILDVCPSGYNMVF